MKQESYLLAAAPAAGSIINIYSLVDISGGSARRVFLHTAMVFSAHDEDTGIEISQGFLICGSIA
jgi:hypothetical protein